jgi:uracil-DNA glycosylase family 4
MNARGRYLARMGIPVYEPRTAEKLAVDGPGGAATSPSRAVEPGPASGPHFPEAAAAEPVETARGTTAGQPLSLGAAAEAWRALEARVSVCTRCALHRGRTQTVFGVGRRDAELMVIGEAPGAEEDRQGEPFVGRAGQLLNAMLRAIGFARGDVYIANILKCRPPNNRDPSPEEAAVCTEYLGQQIELVRPRALLAVGRIAAQWLLQTDSPIGRLRGRAYRFGASGVPLIVTYHPAYLLRSPSAKAKTWQDLCMAQREVAAARACDDEVNG